VGIANVVIRTRAHLAALYAVEDVLVLNTLRYAGEMRDPGELEVPGDLEAAKVTEKELDMAERLVEDMALEWDPTKYRDTYREDLMKMIEEKATGKARPARKVKAPRSAEVIDFAKLLEKSLAATKKREDPAKAKRKPARTRAQGGNHRRAA
jgi:DNA end-binding protein Ku